MPRSFRGASAGAPRDLTPSLRLSERPGTRWTYFFNFWLKTVIHWLKLGDCRRDLFSILVAKGARARRIYTQEGSAGKIQTKKGSAPKKFGKHCSNNTLSNILTKYSRKLRILDERRLRLSNWKDFFAYVKSRNKNSKDSIQTYRHGGELILN